MTAAGSGTTTRRSCARSALGFAALQNRILVILFWRSQKQVLGSHAGWIIAPMTDVHSVRDRTVGVDPRGTMGVPTGVWYSTATATITCVGIDTPGPQPALAAPIHLSLEQKSLLCRITGRADPVGSRYRASAKTTTRRLPMRKSPAGRTKTAVRTPLQIRRKCVIRLLATPTNVRHFGRILYDFAIRPQYLLDSSSQRSDLQSEPGADALNPPAPLLIMQQRSQSLSLLTSQSLRLSY